MDLGRFLSLYFDAQLILSLGTCICVCISGFRMKIVAFKDIHRISLLILWFIFLYPFIAPLLPSHEFSKPSAHTWSIPTASEISRPLLNQTNVKIFDALSTSEGLVHIPLSAMSSWIFILILTGALFCATSLFYDFRILFKLLKDACLIRKINNVSLFTTSKVSTPFSFWIPGKVFVVLPTSLLGDSQNFKIAIFHELQHHRQGDTKIIFLVQILRCVFFWNPLVHLLQRSVEKIHEFACDEALVDQKNVSPLAYGRCLIRVAETALKTRHQLTGTVGMVTSSSGLTLKRRIENMMTEEKKNKSRPITFTLGLICLGLMTATAYASKGDIRDRQISHEQAQKLVKAHAKRTAFPLELNEHVLTQLNRYVGTPEGRAWLKKALQRKTKYEAMIQKIIESYNYPQELMAIALMESGFQNLDASHNKMKAAGLWQFIPGTARHFNLNVNNKVDDRLDPNLQTDAAMRLLGSLHLRFQDWKLAILAYNAGAKKVQDGIDQTGSRDAWQLIAKGFLGDKDYLSKVIAGAIILNNPHLIN